MAEGHAAEERLAELIWRTIKLRVSLLVVTALVLLVVWSALSSGDARAQQVDIEFCRKLAAESTVLPFAPTSADTLCVARTARNDVEAARITNERRRIDWLGMVGTDQNAAARLLRDYAGKKAEFDAYDESRRASYPLQMQLSSGYSVATATLNGQVVAKILPFCVMGVLSLVILLGFQQAAYRRQLVKLLRENRTDSDRALSDSRSQFFGGVVEGAGLGEMFVLSPEGLVVGGLYALLLIPFGAVLFTYAADIVNLTSSIFLSFPCAVLGASFVLATLLWRVRAIYQLHGAAAKDFRRKAACGLRSRMGRRVQGAVAIIAGVSFLFPWASSGGPSPLSGLGLLLRQRSVVRVGQFVIYPLDLRILFEVRIQLVCAILFLLSVGLNAALGSSNKMVLARALRRAQTLLAVLMLFLSLNFLLYIGILEVGGGLTDNTFVTNFLEKVAGLPMSFYDPSYGFVIFLLCCFPLIWLSLRESPSPID
jgi:hypothetical protein